MRRSCGGSFGRRLEDDYVRQAVELAKAHPGVPIKMTWTREEDMTHDFPRPLGMARMRGAVKDGKVEAYDLQLACPSVTASQFGRLSIPALGPDVAIVAGAWDQPFAIPQLSRHRLSRAAERCRSAHGARSARRATASCTNVSSTS